MNLIPAIGPFDIKVYGTQRGFINKPIEFILRNDNVTIEEIVIINPNGNYSSCDISGKDLDGHLSLEFQPEEIGLHEIRVFSNKMNRSLFNSFEFNIYDSSKLLIKPEDEAVVGKNFKIKVECLDDVQGNLIAHVEQQDRKIKSNIKKLKNISSSSSNEKECCSFEIQFVPELESTCKIDIELVEYNTENILYGDSIKIQVKAVDFLIIPFPLLPFHINTNSTFNLKILRDHTKIKQVKMLIKQAANVAAANGGEQTSIEQIACQLKQIESNLYEVQFVPKSIERHFVEIYFDNQLINLDRPVKIDIFDVSKIRAKMPSTITFGELNTFMVDTTGAGEGNLEVIIKDGYDTLKAQLLKREKRKFEIGFVCERNMKHDIQVIFNGIQIKDSPFNVVPELLASRSVEMMSADLLADEFAVIEGGPLDGLQCGEKMWIIFDSQTAPYFDGQFLVSDDNNYPIKHTKIQLEDGRWRIEFIPISVGTHQVQRLLQMDNTTKVQLLLKVNVLHYSASRTVYGYKMYNLDDSVQLVFDAANYRVRDILPEVKDPNDELVENLDCKYLSDYMALKFVPELTGGYMINFYDRNTQQSIASSPYKVIVHEDLKEIMRSSGIYDLTRLIISASNLPKDYDLKQLSVLVKDPHDQLIQNCFFTNKKQDLVIEFISRKEGVHKVYLYIKGELVDDNPFYIHVNGDVFTTSSAYGLFTAIPYLKTSINNFGAINSSSSIEFAAGNNPTTASGYGLSAGGSGAGGGVGVGGNSGVSNSMAADLPGILGNMITSGKTRSIDSNSDSQIMSQSNNVCLAALGHGTILCARREVQFHYVINDKNIQGLCVYDPLNDPVPFKLSQDDHENGSVILTAKLEGAHKIVGLVEGRDFEAQLFVLNKPCYETLFEMNNYSDENIIEKPFVITLKEPNLEVDAYDPLGERIDVRYSGDNLATFIPRTTGYFKIYISDYHGPLLGSPFYALISQLKDTNDELACVESSGIRDTVRNEEAKFIIRNKDMEIDVQIKNPQNVNLSLRKKRTSQGYLQVFYTPECIGPHEIHIFKDGIKVLGSPIIVFVSDPNEVKIENLEREARINKPFSFNIDANQAGEGFIRVNIKDPKLNDILPEITELSERKYLVSFLPKLPGIYEFLLTFNKYHIIESPFKVIIRDEQHQQQQQQQQQATAAVEQSDLQQSDLASTRGKVKSTSPVLEEEEEEEEGYDEDNQVPETTSNRRKLRDYEREEDSLGKETTSSPGRKKAHLTSENIADEDIELVEERDVQLDEDEYEEEEEEDDSTASDTKQSSNFDLPRSIEYELNNWNLQLNNTLNKIMESTQINPIVGKRTLSPITDTSEEESHDINGQTYRGETVIENVERLPDGSSHLLLRIDDDNELIDSNDPNKARGKYKYRFKRIGLAEKWTSQNETTTITSISNGKKLEIEKIKPAVSDEAKTSRAAENGHDELHTSREQLDDEEYYTIVYTANGMRRESSKTKHHYLPSKEEKKIKLDSKTTPVEASTPAAPIADPTALDATSVNSFNLSTSSIKEYSLTKAYHDEDTSTATKMDDDETDTETESLKVNKKTPTVVEPQPQQPTLPAANKPSPAKFDTNKTKPKKFPNSKPYRASSLDNNNEKFKPEETTQYEYEQVIEQPDNAFQGAKKTPRHRNPNRERSGNNNNQNHHHQDKQQNRNRSADNKPLSKNSAATESSYRLNPNAEEFYPSSFSLAKMASASSMKDGDFPSYDQSSSSKALSVSSTNDVSGPMTPNDRDLHKSLSSVANDQKSPTTPILASSNENIIDFYKLQPKKSPAHHKQPPVKYNLIEPVELSMLHHGEQLKGDESVSYDDLTTLSKSLTTAKNKTNTAVEPATNTTVKQDVPPVDDDDSLAEIEENYVITIRVPNDAHKQPDSSHNDELVKPAKEEREKPVSSNQLSDIKAKFENKTTPQVKEDSLKKSFNEPSSVGKLPKSKVELYDSANKAAGQPAAAVSKPDLKQPIKKLINTNLSPDSQPFIPKQLPPIAVANVANSEPDQPKIEDLVKLRKTEIEKKLLPTDNDEENSPFKRVSAAPTSDAVNQPGTVEKSVKNLLNKYERRPSQTRSESVEQQQQQQPQKPAQQQPEPKSESVETTNGEQAQPQPQPRVVKKLPQSIVQMFDRKEGDVSPAAAAPAPSTAPATKPAPKSNPTKANNNKFEPSPEVETSLSKTLSSLNSSQPYAKSDTVSSNHTDDVYEETFIYYQPVVVAPAPEPTPTPAAAEKPKSDEKVGKLAKSIIDQYEKPVMEPQPDDKLASSLKWPKSEVKKTPAAPEPVETSVPQADEPKKLPKSTFEMYESKPNVVKNMKGRNDVPSRGEIINKSLIKSDPNSNIIYVNKPGDSGTSYKSKQATIVLINNENKAQNAPEDASETAVVEAPPATVPVLADKGVKDLVTKYEKKPASDELAPPASAAEEKQKSPTLNKLISSLSPDAKPFEPLPTRRATSVTKDESVDEPSSKSHAKPPAKPAGNERPSKRFTPQTTTTTATPAPTQPEPPKFDTKNFPFLHEAEHQTTVPEVAEPTTNKKKPAGDEERAIKKLINKYEQSSPAPVEEPKPSVEVVEPPAVEKPKIVTKFANQQPKEKPFEKNESIDKEIKSVMVDKGVKKLVDVYENKPQMIETGANAPVPTNPAPKESVVGRLGKLIESDNNKDLTSGVGENNQQPKSEKQPAEKIKKLPKSIYEKYEPSKSVPDSKPVVAEEKKETVDKQQPPAKLPPQQPQPQPRPQEEKKNDAIVKPKPTIMDQLLPSLLNSSQILDNNNLNVMPEIRVFHSENSDLCAILHIPNKTSTSSEVSLKKVPKIRCVLRIDSNDPLVYHITTSSGRKVPYKVRHRSNKSIAVFSYHRVVDFNVVIESQAEIKPKSYKAQLEIMVPDEYDFKILQKDNLELVPIEINRDPDNVYQINFEPSTTLNYIVKSKLKNELEDLRTNSKRSTATKSEYKLNQETVGTSSSRTEYENAGRSRSQQNFKNAPHERRTLSSNSSLVDDSLSATGHLVPFKSRTLSSQQLSDIENILERTKTEIHQKLTDVDASAIKVQLEVEYKDQLAFEVKKASNDQPIDFEPMNNLNNRHVIHFNYDSLVDFTIGVKNNANVVSDKELIKAVREPLNAYIEISVNGDYEFQIVKKDTQEPIDINVTPSSGNLYKIEFHPSPVTKYTLKANQRQAQIDYKKEKKMIESTGVKSSLLKPMLTDLAASSMGENETNNIKINVSITGPTNSVQPTESVNNNNKKSWSKLFCKIYNPRNLEINEITPTFNNNDFISFIVNAFNAGRGILKCRATYPDGETAPMEQYQLEKFIYSIKIFQNKTRNPAGYFNLYLEYLNE